MSAIDDAVKQLGNTIAQFLLNTVTEAMSLQLAGLARIPQQLQIPQSLQLPTTGPIPANPIEYQTQNYYQEPQRGGRRKGRRSRGRGGRGGRGRGRGNIFQPYE